MVSQRSQFSKKQRWNSVKNFAQEIHLVLHSNTIKPNPVTVATANFGTDKDTLVMVPLTTYALSRKRLLALSILRWSKKIISVKQAIWSPEVLTTCKSVPLRLLQPTNVLKAKMFSSIERPINTAHAVPLLLQLTKLNQPSIMIFTCTRETLVLAHAILRTA